MRAVPWEPLFAAVGRQRRVRAALRRDYTRERDAQRVSVRNKVDDSVWDDSDFVGTDAFTQICAEHEGNLVDKWRHYLPIYDRLMGPFRDGFTDESGVRRPLRFLEIGVSQGGSQQLWRKYLGPEAVIFGIDINPDSAKAVDPSNSQVRIGSQADPEFLRSVVAEMGGVDVVLDDGSHVAQHQRVSLQTLWPLLPEGGMFMCEDVHTAYWTQFEGGLRSPGSYIEEIKELIDDMHAHYHDGGLSSGLLNARDEVGAIQIFDSIVAIEKAKRGAPKRRMWGNRSW